jgi:hypothetical protein
VAGLCGGDGGVLCEGAFAFDTAESGAWDGWEWEYGWVGIGRVAIRTMEYIVDIREQLLDLGRGLNMSKLVWEMVYIPNQNERRYIIVI